jgi:hypothetical protein
LLDSLEPNRHGNARQVYSLETNLVLRHSTALAPGCLMNRAATARLEVDMALQLAEKTRNHRTFTL